MILKCLSVRQPYATAILTGQKAEEYRSWRTNHRGLLAIHASGTLAAPAFVKYPNLHPGRVRRGAVLGVVEVYDCVEAACGGYAWLLREPRWLREPLPLKGRVGLFPIEVDVE